MARLKPFRALRYDVGRAGRLDDLVAPPHDVISPEARARLLAASPYNAVRLIRPDDVLDAARLLRAWQDESVLRRESEPAVWCLTDEFVGPDGVRRMRRGLVARVRLEPYSSGKVLPHEQTFAKAKDARLELLRATRTKLSPILLLHEGEPTETPDRPADVEATLGGTTSRVWRVTNSSGIERELARVHGRLVIADGHHRYETALRFHEEDGTEETAYVLAALVSRSDPGLVILPTHRVAAAAPTDLNGRDQMRVREALDELGRLPRQHAAFVLVRPAGATVVESAKTRLDTALVDELPLEGVTYTASAAEAELAVASGAAAAAFLVRPPTIEQVEKFATAGERMPPKSTYFYPKLTCGLVFAPFDE